MFIGATSEGPLSSWLERWTISGDEKQIRTSSVFVRTKPPKAHMMTVSSFLLPEFLYLRHSDSLLPDIRLLSRLFRAAVYIRYQYSSTKYYTMPGI